MSYRARLGVLLACALAAACGKAVRTDVTVTDAGAPDTNGAAELEAWQRMLAEALCVQERSCPVLTPTYFPSFDACMDARFGILSSQYAYYGGVDHFADWASVYRISSSEAQQRCLSALSSCVRLSDAPCAEVLVARAPSPLGGACGGDSWHTPRVCAEGLFCSRQTGCPTCQPRVAESQNCDNAQCQSGLYCKQNYHFMGDVVINDPSYCQRLLQAGDACDHQGCAPGLTCRSGQCSPTIMAAPGAPCESSQCPPSYNCIDKRCQREPDRDGPGTACGHGGYGCASSLQCVKEKCQALAPEGATCLRASWTEGSRCQRWCVFDRPDALEGHCSGSPPTVAPVPCSIYQWGGVGCPAGTHPDMHGEEPEYASVPAYCQCEPDVPDEDENSCD
jgi:hypothetical protein